MESRIGFSVDGTEQVESTFRRLHDSADSLARDMIRSSRQYSTSGREVVQDIEAQIRAIERRSRVEQDARRANVADRLQAGTIDQATSRRELRTISTEAQEDSAQVRLLRDIIATIRDTSREQIRQDREGVERSIRNDDRLTQLGIADDEDEFDALRRTLQRQDLGDAREQEEEESRRISGGSVGRGAQVGGTFAGQNIYVAMASLMALVPMVGDTLSALGQQALNTASSYQEAMGANVGITGGTQGRYAGFGAGSSMFGYSMTESLRLREQATRASGQMRGVQDITDLQILQRGAGLNQGTLMQMERMGREDISGSSTRQTVQSTISALRSTGAITGQNLALLPEYLEQLVSLGRDQLATSGRIDSGINVKTVAAISGLDETFKSPTVLGGMMSSIQGGLSQAPTQISGAMQLSALSRMNPGASLWGLEKMRENPLAQGTGYLQSMLSTLQQASGGNEEMFFRNIFAQGLAPSRTMAERLGRGFQQGNLQDVVDAGGLGMNLETRAQEATPELRRATVAVENRMAEAGDFLVKKIDKMLDKVNSVFTENANIMKQANEHNEVMIERMDGLIENSSGLTKALRTLSSLYQNQGGIHGNLR